MGDSDNGDQGAGTGGAQDSAVHEGDANNGEQRNGRRQYREDTDGRALFQPSSKYSPNHRRAQRYEAFYIFGLLAGSLISLACLGLGLVDRFLASHGVPAALITSCRRFEWIAAGGLLGGTVYAAKWLYHSVAKGLWHEDRRIWRLLSPWIALGATVGIGALVDAGFFRDSVGRVAVHSGAKLTGLGFLIGYLADRFLAKMKELMQVLFGESEAHYTKRAAGSHSEETRDF